MLGKGSTQEWHKGVGVLGSNETLLVHLLYFLYCLKP